MATERQTTLALTPQERTERLLDFRFKTIADVLDAPPSMIVIDELQEALAAKQEAAIDKLLMPKGTDEYEGKVARIRAKIGLTKDEVDALRRPFPGFPETTPETLNEEAYTYFSQEDEKGRKTYQLLIEEVIEEFWLWATPRPTMSVSAFTQGK